MTKKKRRRTEAAPARVEEAVLQTSAVAQVLAEEPGRSLPGSTAPKRSVLVAICLGLLAITWAVFGGTGSYDFVNYDDPAYVYEERRVASGLTLAGLKWAFTQSHASNWHPLTTISHMLDSEIYGLHAGRHHLTNVVLHSAAVVLLFVALHRLTGAVWRSAFVAAVFAIHPLRVESVAWVSERKDVLSGMFFMLTLIAYVRYARARSLRRYLLVALLFALALMSKQTVVTAPLVLLLLDHWPLKRFEAAVPAERRAAFVSAILEKIPLVLLSGATAVATILSQQVTIAPVQGLPLAWRLENALVSSVVYLWQMIWPAKLAVFYPHPAGTLSLWTTLAAATFLVAASAGAILWRRKQPAVFTGWFWYLAMLVPVIGIVQVGGQAHADRYTYLPHIGIYLALTWMVADELRLPHRRAVAAALATLVLVASMWAARLQTSFWRDSESLWRRALAVTSGNDIAHSGLGDVLLSQGKPADAIPHFEAAVKLRATFADAENNLAVGLTETGRPREAIAHLERVLAANPRHVEAHYNLGNALAKSGRAQDAATEYQRALSINPEHAKARSNLANVYLQQGHFDAAIAEYNKALEIDPNNASAHYNIGNSHFQKGAIDAAIAHYEKAQQIRPDYAEAQNNLGLARFQKGQIREAIGHWRRALQLRPDLADALNNLAWVLATAPDTNLRDGAAAIELAGRAAELHGGKSAPALRTLAAAYAESGRFSEALEVAARGADLAMAQFDFASADALKADIASYKANVPLRVSTPAAP